MSSQLSGRLRAARHARFVGRAAEKDLFQTALAAPELPLSSCIFLAPVGLAKPPYCRSLSRWRKNKTFPLIIWMCAALIPIRQLFWMLCAAP